MKRNCQNFIKASATFNGPNPPKSEKHNYLQMSFHSPHLTRKEPGLHKTIITTGKSELHLGLSLGFTSPIWIFISCCNILISTFTIIRNKKAAAIYRVPANTRVKCLLYAKRLTGIIGFERCQNSVIALHLVCTVEEKGSQRVQVTFQQGHTVWGLSQGLPDSITTSQCYLFSFIMKVISCRHSDSFILNIMVSEYPQDIWKQMPTSWL